MIVWVARYFCEDSPRPWVRRDWIKGVYASKELADAAVQDDRECFDILPFAVEGIPAEALT